MSDAQKAVIAGGEAARDSAASLAHAAGDVINQALREMAARLTERAPEILAANAADMADGEAAGLGQGLLDRLRLDPGRMQEMARQIGLLADAPFPPAMTPLGDLPGGPSGGRLRLAERRVPVGVIGANFEARPNVTIDIASQLLKSRNAGVLRTGGAALRSAAALADHVIAPAAAGRRAGSAGRAAGPVRGPGSRGRAGPPAGTDPAGHPARQRGDHAQPGRRGRPGRGAHARPRRRGRRALPGSRRRPGAGRRDRHRQPGPAGCLQPAEPPADLRTGVGPAARGGARAGPRLGITPSLPPHDHPLGHEWALDSGHEATLTIAPADSPAAAAALANDCTSGLAAGIVTADPAAAREFLDAYRGTGAFWNATTRLLDGFKLRGVPETGINVDHVPGPRGPVTFHDLCLRQYVVVPA